MSFLPRPCPVCLGTAKEVVFQQEFSSYSEGTLMEGYDLALCATCGAAFADAIPDQKTFDRYYAQMSKYEYGDSGGAPDETTSARFRQVVDFVGPFIERQHQIADIGCATAGLLGEFKKRGFENVVGFDPSPTCAQAARRLHDISVRTAAIGDLTGIAERFDVILLTGVMEHVRDVDAALKAIVALLSPQGRLYLEVPDVTRYFRWFSAPFQFLSMEHVNFFSPISLTNLAARHGLAPLFVERVDRYLSPRAGEPAVAALFQRPAETATSSTPRFTFDSETGPTLQAYLESSRTQERRIASIIENLVDEGKPLAVWGAGTHTLRLLKVSALAKANLVRFIDSNSSYQGKELRGIPIVAPKDFDRKDATILISSHAAEEEIREQIKTRLRWPNETVCLYEGVSVETGASVPIP